jgi:hypothetical protein
MENEYRRCLPIFSTPLSAVTAAPPDDAARASHAAAVPITGERAIWMPRPRVARAFIRAGLHPGVSTRRSGYGRRNLQGDIRPSERAAGTSGLPRQPEELMGLRENLLTTTACHRAGITGLIGKSALLVATSLVAGALGVAPAAASSHREAPLITSTPRLDGTDFYMFRSYEPGRQGFTTLIADYQPLQDPNGGPNYFELEPHGVYEIHIDNNGDGVEDITFQFRFTNNRQNLALNIGGVNVPIALVQDGQVGRNGNPADTANLNVQESYTLSIIRGAEVTGVPQAVTDAATGATSFSKPVDNIGFKTLPDYAAYADAQIHNIQIPGCGNGRVFVGQRKDPFVVNLGETFDLINYANPVGEQFANSARDDIADKNVTSLILEVPTTCLTAKDPVIGGWTTASKSEFDDFAVDDDTTSTNLGLLTQVSRLGMPLANELLIGLKDKDAFNASQPITDARFLVYFANPTLPAIIQELFGTAAPTLFPRQDLIATFLTGIQGLNQPANVIPAEMLRLNTATPVTPAASQNRLGVIGGDNAGFPNGRRPGDDVVDIELRVAMGRLITLGLFGTPAQAPSGGLDFTDGAIVTSAFFDTTFPYLKTPIAGSPGAAQPSVPQPPDAVLSGLNPVSVQ